jgi:hypothetical protein
MCIEQFLRPFFSRGNCVSDPDLGGARNRRSVPACFLDFTCFLCLFLKYKIFCQNISVLSHLAPQIIMLELQILLGCRVTRSSGFFYLF